LRFESLRDGIEEFEKIQILKDTLTGQDLEDLRNVLQTINTGFTASGTAAATLIPQARDILATLAAKPD
jgi:hypothetical protein